MTFLPYRLIFATIIAMTLTGVAGPSYAQNEGHYVSSPVIQLKPQQSKEDHRATPPLLTPPKARQNEAVVLRAPKAEKQTPVLKLRPPEASSVAERSATPVKLKPPVSNSVKPIALKAPTPQASKTIAAPTVPIALKTSKGKQDAPVTLRAPQPKSNNQITLKAPVPKATVDAPVILTPPILKMVDPLVAEDPVAFMQPLGAPPSLQSGMIVPVDGIQDVEIIEPVSEAAVYGGGNLPAAVITSFEEEQAQVNAQVGNDVETHRGDVNAPVFGSVGNVQEGNIEGIAASPSGLVPSYIVKPVSDDEMKAPSAQAAHQAYPDGSFDAPIDFESDNLTHNDVTGVVSATGSVHITQSGRLLQAHQVDYNTQSGQIDAIGAVSLIDANGDVHRANRATLTNEMKQGEIHQLNSYLADGGHFTAEKGVRHSETLLTLHDATYTPCDCKLDKKGNPVWRMRSSDIVYNEEEHKITYKNSRFEVYGTPVLWLPYFAHYDSHIKRKSGLLIPSAGYNTQLGAIYAQNYYVDIAPDMDATVGTMLSTQENPVGLLEVRRRWASAELTMGGSLTQSKSPDLTATGAVVKDNRWRGHVTGRGRWDINDKWRSGVNIDVSSDEQYLRQYDFSSEDVLENEVYAERFDDRDYASIRGIAFQDLRIGDQGGEQPNVLPEIDANFLGDPNEMLGGRWAVTGNALGLIRDGNGQDMARGVAKIGWQRRDTTNVGLVNTVDVSTRADAYQMFGQGTNGAPRDKDTAARLFPQFHNVTSMPFVKPVEEAQIFVEPLAALTVGTNVDSNADDIPNEDSRDAQIDYINLFSPDRFPGYDRIEDRSRVTYGMRSGVYWDTGSRLVGFLGQSYNLDDKDNPFPQGSGLDRRASDVVGSLNANLLNSYYLNYRFQLDDKSLASVRHELDLYAGHDKFSYAGRYLYANNLEGENLSSVREQIESSVGYHLTKSWHARLGGLYDLGEDRGLRSMNTGLDYTGCCVNYSISVQRQLTTDFSGDNGLSVMFRMGLKGIGEFQAGN